MNFLIKEHYKAWILLSVFMIYRSFCDVDDALDIFNGLMWLLGCCLWINNLRLASANYKLLQELNDPSMVVIRNFGQTKFIFKANGDVYVQGGLSINGTSSPDTSNGGMQIK